MEQGIVRRVIGAVVDVEFPSGRLPEIYHAIEVRLPERKVVMEAVQQLGHNVVRCVSLFSTDGLYRGCTAVDTGAPVTMPVGEATLRISSWIRTVLPTPAPPNNPILPPLA